ncbi:hypothetical protein H0H92_001389, partial [Tricholoma furcatifolium]
MPKTRNITREQLDESRRRLAEKALLADMAPFYNQTRGTGDLGLFLDAFYAVWWHQFPLNLAEFDGDRDALEFTQSVRNKQLRQDLMWAASRSKIIALYPWREYVSVEEDVRRQNAVVESWERQMRPRPHPRK